MAIDTTTVSLTDEEVEFLREVDSFIEGIPHRMVSGEERAILYKLMDSGLLRIYGWMGWSGIVTDYVMLTDAGREVMRGYRLGG